jgi:hypothetical protein
MSKLMLPFQWAEQLTRWWLSLDPPPMTGTAILQGIKNVFSLSLSAGHNKLECLLVHFKRTVQLTTNDSKPSSYSNQIKRKLGSSVLLIDLMTLLLF